MSANIKGLLKTLGPGLLWAGAAIGVSHLVQSTKAGATFGYELIWVIIIANLLKYPFFEFGPRYAAATGEPLLTGYARLGKWAVYILLLLTIGTMFSIQAAVTVVTAGLCISIFDSTLSPVAWSAILLALSLFIIAVGKYATLDKVVKFIILSLTISTIAAVIMTLGYEPETKTEFAHIFSWEDDTHIIFLIALVGWMPAPIDIAVWHSFWTVARSKETGYAPKLKESLFDFNVGYIGTAFLATCFLILGAQVMYGSGEVFSDSGGKFANQLINLYSESIGGWSKLIISVAALATMFSTTITCLDAFPRVLTPTTKLLFPQIIKIRGLNYIWILIVIAGALVLLGGFIENMGDMVKLATILSFLTAPVLAFLNYRVVTSTHMPAEARPALWLRILSWAGIVFLIVFSLWYLKILLLPA